MCDNPSEFIIIFPSFAGVFMIPCNTDIFRLYSYQVRNCMKILVVVILNI